MVNVAAIATGNSWAVPIINGADAIDDGADPEDVFKTIVVSTVTAGAADAVGEVASAALTDQVGSTMANFVTDASINVVTNGGDIGAAVLDAGLSSTGVVSDTVGKITDAVGLDTASEIGKNLKDSFTEGVTASLLGGDGIQAASVAAMSNFLKPMVGRIGNYTPEVKEDVARVLSTGFTASAQGKNVYSAINNELGSIATEDLRNTVKETVLNYLDPAEEPPSTLETFVEEAKKEEPKEEIVQGDPLTEAQDLYEKIDAPPPVSQPLTTTYTPPGGVPGEKAPTPSIPELTPEADKGIPSAPENLFPTITESDLLDPSGKPYGVDTTSAERLEGTADLASKEGVSELDPFYGQYLEGKEAGEKAKKEAEGKPSFDTQMSDVFKNLGSNTLREIIAGVPEGTANLTDQAIDAFKKAAQTYAASVEAQFGFVVKPEDLRIKKEGLDSLVKYEAYS